MRLIGKTVLITGASSGIGKQTALDLCKDNTVILIARNEEKLKEVTAAIIEHSPKSAYYVCDVSKEQQVKSTVQKILREHEKIDMLINNAGFGINKGFLDTAETEWRQLIDTNYFGTVYMIRHVLPSMLKRKYGHIVNIGSVVSKMAVPNMSTYCSSKHAIMGLTESLYYELKGTGVNISIVLPGKTDTNFFDNPTFKAREALKSEKYNKAIPPKLISAGIRKAIEKNLFELTVPGKFYLFYFIKYNFPRLYRKLMERLY